MTASVRTAPWRTELRYPFALWTCPPGRFLCPGFLCRDLPGAKLPGRPAPPTGTLWRWRKTRALAARTVLHQRCRRRRRRVRQAVARLRVLTDEQMDMDRDGDRSHTWGYDRQTESQKDRQIHGRSLLPSSHSFVPQSCSLVPQYES